MHFAGFHILQNFIEKMILTAKKYNIIIDRPYQLSAITFPKCSLRLWLLRLAANQSRVMSLPDINVKRVPQYCCLNQTRLTRLHKKGFLTFAGL